MEWEAKTTRTGRAEPGSPGTSDGTRQDPGYLEAMLRFSLALNTATTLDEVLEVCVATALCLTRRECGAIYLVTEATRTLHLARQQGLSDKFLETSSTLTYESPLVARILAGERVDMPDGAARPAGEPSCLYHELACFTVLPLRYRGRVIGALLVGSRQMLDHSSTGIAWLETVATLMGSAIVRLRMEASLRENRKRHQRLILNVPGAVFQFRQHHDGTYSFPFISAAAREIFGLEPEVVMSNHKTPYHTLHPDEVDNLHRAVRMSAQTGRPFRMEIRHVVNGKLRWCDCHSRPERQPNGEILWDGVMLDITERKQMERELKEAKAELEQRVEERTAELAEINRQLIFELNERGKIERILRQREAELKSQAKGLEEMNTALKVLLKRREDDKLDLEKNVVTNVQELVVPFLEKIRRTRTGEQQATYLSLLESTLHDIVSPFLHGLSHRHPNLTPTEIRVAQLVREGMTTKEIGEALALSPRTIETHRKNIRRKLGLGLAKGNLRSHLLTCQ